MQAIAAEWSQVTGIPVNFVDSSGVVPEVCTDRYNCGGPLRSGVVLSSPFTYNDELCSMGFTASGSDGSRWAITAGHCADVTGDNTNWAHGAQNIGPMREATNPDLSRS